MMLVHGGSEWSREADRRSGNNPRLATGPMTKGEATGKQGATGLPRQRHTDKNRNIPHGYGSNSQPESGYEWSMVDDD